MPQLFDHTLDALWALLTWLVLAWIALWFLIFVPFLISLSLDWLGLAENHVWLVYIEFIRRLIQ
jgi:hypothetical protein